VQEIFLFESAIPTLGPPSLLLNGDQGPFHWRQSGWGVKLASHLHLMLGVRNAYSHAYNFMTSRSENITAAHKVHHCLQEYTSKAKTDDSSDWRVVFHSHDVHTQTSIKKFHLVPHYQQD